MKSGREPFGGFHPESGLGTLGILGNVGAFGGAETGGFGFLGEEPPVKDPDLGAVGHLAMIPT